jgi:hypothetical protein
MRTLDLRDAQVRCEWPDQECDGLQSALREMRAAQMRSTHQIQMEELRQLTYWDERK